MRLHVHDVLLRAHERGYSVDEIRPCFVDDLGDGWYEVDVEHASYPRARDSSVNVVEDRDAFIANGLAAFGATKPMPRVIVAAPLGGPGTELHALLKDWLGIEPKDGCSCRKMAETMNRLGPDWCESDEGMAEILVVMRTEHEKRRAEGTTILPWTDFGARQLVLLACRRARAKAAG